MSLRPWTIVRILCRGPDAFTQFIGRLIETKNDIILCF